MGDTEQTDIRRPFPPFGRPSDASRDDPKAAVIGDEEAIRVERVPIPLRRISASAANPSVTVIGGGHEANPIPKGSVVSDEGKRLPEQVADVAAATVAEKVPKVAGDAGGIAPEKIERESFSVRKIKPVTDSSSTNLTASSDGASKATKREQPSGPSHAKRQQAEEMYRLGMAAAHRGDYPAAIAKYTACLGIWSGHAEALARRGLCNIMCNNHTAGLADCDAATDLAGRWKDPDTVMHYVHYARGLRHSIMGGHAAALQELEEAQLLAQREPELGRTKKLIRSTLEDQDKAEKLKNRKQERAAGRRGPSAPVKPGLVTPTVPAVAPLVKRPIIVELDSSPPAPEASSASEDTAAVTETAEAYRAKGKEAFAAGWYEDAAVQFRYAAELDPTQAVHWNDLAATLLKMERWADAEKSATKALELDSKDAKARYRRGIAYERQGKLQEAYVDLSLASKGGQGEASKAMNVLQAKIQRRGEELPRSV